MQVGHRKCPSKWFATLEVFTPHCFHMLQGETLLVKEFPKKIVQLNEMIQQADWTENNLSNVHEDLNIPVPEPHAANKYVSAFLPRLVIIVHRT